MSVYVFGFVRIWLPHLVIHDPAIHKNHTIIFTFQLKFDFDFDNKKNKTSSTQYKYISVGSIQKKLVKCSYFVLQCYTKRLL